MLTKNWKKKKQELAPGYKGRGSLRPTSLRAQINLSTTSHILETDVLESWKSDSKHVEQVNVKTSTMELNKI